MEMAGQKKLAFEDHHSKQVVFKIIKVKKNGWAEKLAFEDLHSKQVVFKIIGG